MLMSLEVQTLKPYEVVIIAKDLDDETKSVINSHERNLNIDLVKQVHGHLAHAYSLGIKRASGNLILFIDDDAFAELAWVEKYTKIFSQYENLGGASGRVITYKLNDSGIVVDQSEIRLPPNREAFWRRPLKKLESYCGGISVSGLNFKKPCHDKEEVVLSALMHGSNMAFKKDAIDGVDLDELFKNSRRALGFEMILAYWSILKGYRTLRFFNKEAPTVYHLQHKGSATAGETWRDVFWKHYDRAKQFYRLKKLGAEVSFLAYIVAMLLNARKSTLPKLLAFLYAQLF